MAQETPEYYDVRAGSYDTNARIYRFARGTRGEQRAQEYADAYNKSLREGMGLRDEDVDLRMAQHMSPEDCDRAMRAETYRANRAHVVMAKAVPVIEDHDPMPTDYPHGY
ncbi:hypothetical protein [Streptomyces sp. 5-10]|uniref:hypothetical protein n=1 Tax=Streptomyces sp. 5-10 TaxID=878925 RepID=UPI00168B1EBE|nr:hypothetical protein [Streptomyces sp. 5-10]MBD3004576.1 hypothetical protein [Streptomyces sp. 5-10]